MRVLVTHPGRQHSHQMAVALAEAGMLGGYWAGVPAVAAQGRHLPASLRRRFARYAPVALDPGRVRWLPFAPGLRRLGDIVLPPRAAAWADFSACRLFDRRVAWLLDGEPIDAVIACEISALSTFRAARRRGIATILDAPSLHHQAQDRLHGTTDSSSLHQRVTRTKDREIALADHILTVSSLARDTYLTAGAPPGRVHALPLGADLELFSPGEGSPPAGEQGFRFLFSGATIRRKGFDLLLAAFDRVAAEEPTARLRVVGPPGDAAERLAGRWNGRISVSGSIGQAELAGEFRRADCLVLPSRNDSFGMVVPEAMATGLPVLVSEMVGAKQLVQSGKNGWVVPVEDVDSLAAQMLWCVRHPEAVRAMRPACRRAAEAATWPAYHRRLVDLMRAIVPARSAA